MMNKLRRSLCFAESGNQRAGILFVFAAVRFIVNNTRDISLNYEQCSPWQRTENTGFSTLTPSRQFSEQLLVETNQDDK